MQPKFETAESEDFKPPANQQQQHAGNSPGAQTSPVDGVNRSSWSAARTPSVECVSPTIATPATEAACEGGSGTDRKPQQQQQRQQPPPSADSLRRQPSSNSNHASSAGQFDSPLGGDGSAAPPPPAQPPRRSRRSSSSAAAGTAAVAVPAASPADWDHELDILRSRVFALAVAQVVLGVVGIPFCWIGYGFTALLLILLLTFGGIGVVHFHSLNAMRFTTCCCHPMNAVKQLHTAYVVVTIFALLALACNVIHAAMGERHSKSTTMIFAVIACAHSIVTIGVVGCAVKSVAALRDRCAKDELMLAGPDPCGGNPDPCMGKFRPRCHQQLQMMQMMRQQQQQQRQQGLPPYYQQQQPQHPPPYATHTVQHQAYHSPHHAHQHAQAAAGFHQAHAPPYHHHHHHHYHGQQQQPGGGRYEGHYATPQRFYYPGQQPQPQQQQQQLHYGPRPTGYATGAPATPGAYPHHHHASGGSPHAEAVMASPTYHGAYPPPDGAVYAAGYPAAGHAVHFTPTEGTPVLTPTTTPQDPKSSGRKSFK